MHSPSAVRCSHSACGPLPCTPHQASVRLGVGRRHSGRPLAAAKALKKKEDLDVGWLQTTEEVHLLVPTDPQVRKADLSFQVHPQRLQLAVKGESLLSGDLPEPVDIDGCFWAFEDTADGRMIHITLEKKQIGHESWPSPLETQQATPGDETTTHRAFMELAVGGSSVGKVVFALYGNSLPKTVENFRALCTGEKGQSSAGAVLSYKGSSFHRIIPSFMAQGGDFTEGNGTGGVSVYGSKFDDEGFFFKHDKPGKLSMANSGPNTNGSQFFVTYGRQPHLDGKHVVFGHVESGMQTLLDLQKLGSASGKVSEAVTILDCGEAPAVE